jgi:hypothetical protein
MERSVKSTKIDRVPKDHFLVHHRYSPDEYLIDHKAYRYIMEYITNYRYSLHMIPDDEYITCEKILDQDRTERSVLRINEIVFE